ncbi:MAG: phospholipase D-like domain-containing protein [Candidatus Sericytochromatia bacterium]
MAQIRVGNHTLPLEQLRELKPDTSPDAARQALSGNGLDEVLLKSGDTTYLAVGESLQLSALSGASQVQIQLNGESRPAEVLATQDDITSWSEGWSKGKSVGQSLSQAWQGLSSRPDWSGVHALSSAVSRWPAEAPPSVAVAPPRAPRPEQPLPAPGQAASDSTALAPPQAPLSSRVQAFFTTPGQSNGPAPDQALGQFIRSARQTVEIAAFELDNPVIRDAILAAHADGRKVRVVTDSDYAHEPDLQALKTAGIEVIEDQRSGLMHNKFVVVDAGTPDGAVWTGSMNMTDNCVYRNNNNALLIRSPELAANFRMEFEEMFTGRQFGRTSPNVVPHPSVTVGHSRIETYFAAEGRVAGKVAEALNKASQSIHFMAFSFTHDGIGEVVAQKLGAGVQVRGVFEKVGSGTQYSEFGALKAAGADVRTDGNSKILHHKVFVIDGKTVITGSFNFSDSADEKNDENLLIIEDAALAQQYLAEFERVYAQGNP